MQNTPTPHTHTYTDVEMNVDMRAHAHTNNGGYTPQYIAYKYKRHNMSRGGDMDQARSVSAALSPHEWSTHIAEQRNVLNE